MTLAEKLLPKLSEWKPIGSGRHAWSETFPQAGWSASLTADAVDTMSCLVWELTLMRMGDAPHDAALPTWAAAVADRATGLMEPLKVHEVDTTHGEAVLRSESPAKKGESLAYFEVRLSGVGKAVVRRFKAAKGTSGREQVAFALTHEVIAKLVGDIVG